MLPVLSKEGLDRGIILRLKGSETMKWKWIGKTKEARDNDEPDRFYRDHAATWLSDSKGAPILVPWDYESYQAGLYISETNARLIAAAPETKEQRDDLLEACKYTIEKLKSVKGKAFSILPILQAIAKAEKGD